MFSNSDVSKNILTVTKLNRLARSVLEGEIGQVWLMAEISNFTAASSGHWYFTLKDDKAQIRSAMFRNANMRVRTRPREGDKVLVRGSISIYEARGDYQLIAEHMEPAGEGMLKQQFEQLKIKLAGEGLFAQQHKRPLPAHVNKVGVVTSPTGAALHDIITVLGRRSPMTHVIVYPSQVQGDTAPANICRAIEIANARSEVDVLIVGRGGGSLEDLWCFNDETVARAMFESTLPIVSAVGHEVDVTIADFVADVRAPTPSAAAELVSQNSLEQHKYILQLVQRLRTSVSENLRFQSQRAHQLDQRLSATHPRRHLQQQQQRLDQLTQVLRASFEQQTIRAERRLDNAHARLCALSPANTIALATHNIETREQRLQNLMKQQVEQARQALQSYAHLLETVSPLATLARGYSITFHNGKVVKDQQDVSPGDTLTTKLKGGDITSQVLRIDKNNVPN